MGMRAVVRQGHIVVEQPVDLPEGTEFDLCADDGGDDLTAAVREALHERLRHSFEQARRGEVQPASRILERLATRR